MKSMKSKVMSSKAGPFAKGGGNKMSGMNYAGPQMAGQSASKGQKSNAKVAKAGGKKMAGFTGARSAKKM
jgi:hypothetical protein